MCSFWWEFWRQVCKKLKNKLVTSLHLSSVVGAKLRARPPLRPYFILCIPGLVYRGEYMVNWSPRLGTAVSDLEVDYSEEPGHLFFFR
jgi:leucyl-tRNA synthetase